MPKISLTISSVPILQHLIASGKFVTSTSRLIAESLSLKILLIDLRLGSWPAVIITLKHRTLSPVAERFIHCAREVVKSIVGETGHIAET
jgi:hypothetical protein